ncbi:long-chain fatty acid ligase [Cryptosporidium ubiquitum]|uniref:Long-chain fatty acid ligase n=1 Tax=Cryptosporidium ubiquitum TaxID=857276 RepID=A0A1J4MMW0_9CRYT|nr:long-chain fatty acid ligase [Cryptosporidium ubiquitum]OII75569.1 long-chain fatty acid ligase [Cryptosporidium ubiquitum]
MGNVPSNIFCQNDEFIYSCPIEGTGDLNSTEIRRSKETVNSELISNFHEKLENCWEVLLHGKEVSNNGEFMGFRVPLENGELSEYRYVKYSYVIRKAKELGSGLLHVEGVEERKFDDCNIKLKCVALFAKNSLNWSITEHACNAYGISTIPLYDVLGNSGITYILNSTLPKTVFCSVECCKKLLPLLESIKSVKILIMINNDSKSIQEDITEYVKENVTIMDFEELIKIGKSNPREISPGTLDSIHSIHYTSGTTGNPKGAVLTHRAWISCAAGFIYGQLGRKGTKLGPDDRHISYLPLAHIFERIVHVVFTYLGGKIGFYSGDVRRIVDDIQLFKPTIFITVPRVLNRIHDKVMMNVEQKPKFLQMLFHFALQQKEKKGSPFHFIWDTIVFNKTKEILGGNVKAILSGAAPLDETVLTRIRCFTCSYCFEGYGMTELLAAFMSEISDNSKNIIGGPPGCCEFKLVSVPEMDYSVKSNPPAGELVVRGHSSFIGYFRNEEETKAVICEKEGWIKTGDICHLLPNGSIRVIDRRKNIFKLSQGEYVAPEKLENIFVICCELISQALVIGRSTESFLVAIFVLDEEFTMNYVKANKLGDNLKFKDVVDHPKIIEKIRADLEKAEVQHKMLGYEKIRTFKCVSTPFSVENELLTPTFKIVRHKAIKFYEDSINEMYKNGS